MDLTAALAALTKQEKEDECISHVIKLRQAWAEKNYVRFFTLYKSAPKMSGYLIDWFIDRERKAALKIMIKAYRIALPVSYILNALKFESPEDWSKFIQPFSLKFSDASASSLDC